MVQMIVQPIFMLQMMPEATTTLSTFSGTNNCLDSWSCPLRLQFFLSDLTGNWSNSSCMKK